MRIRARHVVLSLASLIAGVVVAAAIGPARAQNSTTVTLGSASGAPNGNICVVSFNCTYVPFSEGSTPELRVPFDGTVTSFSINSGSATGNVELRVLRPAAGGQLTGAGTSPAKTLANGHNTFAVSVPVKAGDLLGLDNDSSALMFDTSDPNPVTRYYQPPPGLADGSTAAPNNTKPAYRLLLSAVVRSSPTSTTTQTTTTTNTTTTILTTLPPGVAPAISRAGLTHRRFRVGRQATAVIARAAVGTTFRFTLSAPARVQIAITHKVKGLRSSGKCVKPTAKLRRRHARACKRTVTVGTLTRTNENAGANSVPFSGRIRSRALKPGRYRAVLGARNTGGSATPVSLSFVVVR